jgi:hypothetical protein
MAVQFLTGNELNHELEKLFEEANEHLILISPYISLHERYASVLRAKLANEKLEIVLVFGKNEEDPSRSMKRTDLEFFMQFPNIEIRFEPRLHAKYYASDDVAIITSMNLYRYSQDHNIEAGVKMDAISFEGDLANRLIGRSDIESEAYKYFERVIVQAKPIYKKVPKYEKAMLGLTKKYMGSEVVEDNIASFFTNDRNFNKGFKEEPIRDAPRSVVKSDPAPARESVRASSRADGYCIRTGKPIPFNVKHPLSAEAFASWSRYKDENYKEKFCHFSGEPSHGDTSVSKPILKKNWSKAKSTFDL